MDPHRADATSGGGPFRVITQDGRAGIIDTASLPLDSDRKDVLVRLEDGAEIWTPLYLLRQQADGTYVLPLDSDQVRAAADDASVNVSGEELAPDELVLPVIEEQVRVGKRIVQTGGVRVSTHLHEDQQVVDEPGYREEVLVERVQVDRPLDEPIQPHTEGDTLVIPIMAEELVVQKRLVLKEEVRITRVRTETRNPQQVTLRRQEVSIEPLPGEEGDRTGK